MNHSEQLDKIAPALLAAQSEFPEVVKDATGKIMLKTGGSYEYGYATLTDLQRAVLPILHKHGIAVAQGTTDEDAAGFTVLTTLLHQSGQWTTNRMRVPLDKPTAQGAGSGMSYGMRYGLRAAVCLITNDLDDDGDAATNPAPAPQRQSVTTTNARPATTNTPSVPVMKAAAATPIAAIADTAADWMTLVLPDGCITCGGPVWDNRDPASRKNVKGPHWKCRDKECKDTRGFVTAGWCEKGAPAVKQTGGGPGLETIPTVLQDEEESLPF